MLFMKLKILIVVLFFQTNGIGHVIAGEIVSLEQNNVLSDDDNQTLDNQQRKDALLVDLPQNDSTSTLSNNQKKLTNTVDKAALPEADKLLEILDSVRGYKDESFSFELSNVSYKQGKLKQRNRLAVQVLDQNSLVEYLTPARQKGRKILKQGPNMWLHLPGTRNVLRVTPSQRLLGEASNGDVTGTTFTEDYRVNLVSISRLQEQEVIRLELLAKHRETAYQKVVFYLNFDTYLPIQSDFYSRSDRLLKQAEYKEFKEFNGELKIHKMLLLDPLKAGSFTWMMFEHYQRENILPSAFHKDVLSR